MIMPSTAVLFKRYQWLVETIADMGSPRKAFVLLAAFVSIAVVSTQAQQRPAPLTPDTDVSDTDVRDNDLLMQPIGANWTSYNGDYTGRRYSSLHDINVANVAKLRAAWVFHPGNSRNLEATPVVINGVMYVTSANDVFALDARTGRVVWHYQRPVSSGLLDDAAAHKNRGVAVWQHFVYLETDDAHLLCLDARSGGLRWDVEYAEKSKHYGATSAPLVVRGAVIVGTSGGDSGVRGFVAAYDAVTGKQKWKFWTIPGPGEFGSSSWPGDAYLHGGGTTWMPGTYDPELNTLYWTTSNPAPDFVGDSRPGDDLYTDCVLALNPETGMLKWFFQFTPHDLYDYDATQIPVLLDAEWEGHPRKLLLQANRNGFFYVLDRTNGTFLSAKPFGKVTWATSIAKDGRPVLNKDAVPDTKGKLVCPAALGLTNWYSPSYDPQTKLFYVATSDECDIFTGAPQPYREGHDFLGSIYVPDPVARPTGALKALDPLTGAEKWQFKYFSNPNGGALSTAGGLVFAGDADGNFIAVDSRTGKDLWHMQLGAAIYSTAVSYRLDGRQYVVIPAGSALFAFGLTAP
jgi:alcohol dehydrogenase (cytochrome c)